MDADARGREVELAPTTMAHGGAAVARLDGRVVFVPDVIPGERVRARITDASKPSFWRAEALEILEPSAHRRPHPWPEASIDRPPERRVGAAEYGFIEPAHQRTLKTAVLRDALQRIGHLDLDELNAHPGVDLEVRAVDGPEDAMGWRTRVRLHVDPEGRLGAMAARSHHVVPVDDVPLASEELRAVLPLGERFTGAATVDALAPTLGEPRLVVGRQAPTVIRERVVSAAGAREFRLDDGGFWQVHAAAPAVLSDAVREAVDLDGFDPAAANLDLYGGVGLLAAALGDLASTQRGGFRVTSVESDGRASEHAAENLAEWVGATAVSARVERWVRTLADASAAERARLERATVVLDPPRAGAGREVLEAIVAVRPAQLVYVACDPVALARDLRILLDSGYETRWLRAFDLFGSTPHLEVVAGLVRGSRSGSGG